MPTTSMNEVTHADVTSGSASGSPVTGRPGCAARQQQRTRRRHAGILSLIAALATVVLVASCAPDAGQPPTSGVVLTADVVSGGIQLDWPATAKGRVNGYQLQFRSDTNPWTDIATGAEPGAMFTAVTPQKRYYFRVRDKFLQGQDPTVFSATTKVFYVEMQLPIVRITTEKRRPILDKVNYIPSTVTLDPNGSDFEAYSGTAGVRGRGNSTWQLSKKPYAIKLDTKSKLMGMPSSKKWVLLANYHDLSQVRTYGAALISEATSLAWTPKYRYVELVLNGEYMGVYQLAEKVDPGKNKVNITEMADTDNEGEALTGGYLLEIDDRLEENNEPGWRTPKNMAVVVKEPDPMTSQQKQYIRNYVNNFENVLFSANYKDPDTGYASLLDVPAFIDYWIVQEVTRNADSFWSSSYFYKDRNSDKLVFGPVWDFDHSMGSPVTAKPQPAEGWYARGNGAWTRRLFTDPAFVNAVIDRWNTLVPVISGIPAQMLATGQSLEPAISNDGARWGYTPGPQNTPDFVASWLTARINWMTDAFAQEQAAQE